MTDSPLRKLTRNAATVARLMDDRADLIRQARERGDTWQAIADALGVRQQSVHKWYQRRLSEE